MQKLTNKEEELMIVLWKLGKAFVKDIRKEYSESRHYNTLSTTMRNLEDKGFVGHEVLGNSHRYYPIVSKEEYRSKYILETIHNYYSNSYKSLVSFFAQEEKISAEELREILDLIEKNK